MIASPYTRNEILLPTPDDRLAALAVALGGRVAGPGCLMTPARARKALLLHGAGFAPTAAGFFTAPGSLRRWSRSDALAISRLTGKPSAADTQPNQD